MGCYDSSQTPAGPDRGNGNGNGNGSGLNDMAGKVYEWYWDWYDAGWYSNGGATTTETRGTNSSLLGARDAGRFVGRRHVLTGLRQWLPQRRSGVRGQLRRILECEGALTFFP